MPALLRLLFVVLLWAGCWGVMRQIPDSRSVRFSPNQHASAMPLAPALYGTETINPSQSLPMVHVAALAQSPDGILHCVWYGGSAECAPDVKIYLAQKEPGGRWTAPVAIMTREQAAHDLGRPVKGVGNALLLAEHDGSLRLLFVTIAMGKWSGSQLNSSISRDGGISWSRAERLTLSPFFNLSELVRNRAVPLQGGGWGVPIYQEFLGKFPELLWLGTDGSYRKSRIAGGCSVFQPSLVPTGDASAVVLMRDYTAARHVAVTTTDDAGAKWSPVWRSSLPNSDSGLSGLPISDGAILLAYNDTPKDRSDLSLAISRNEGADWRRLVSLQHEEGASFGYPFLLRSADGLVHLGYTWKGKELRLISFNDSWLHDQETRSALP